MDLRLVQVDAHGNVVPLAPPAGMASPIITFSGTTPQWSEAGELSVVNRRPVMAQDPADGHWYVVVDGGGTAVIAEG